MTDIIVAIISGVVTLVVSLTASILTFVTSTRKLKQEQQRLFASQIAAQSEKLDTVKYDLKHDLADVHSVITEIKAETQQYQAVMDIQIANLTNSFNDMKQEVREHNNFARRMPVLEERMDELSRRTGVLEEANAHSN